MITRRYSNHRVYSCSYGQLTGECDFTFLKKGLASVYFYDDRGGIYRSFKAHVGGRQELTYAYDTQGNILSERELLKTTAKQTFDRVTLNYYDNAGRVTSTRITENGETAKFSYSYDKRGMLAKE